MQALQHIVLIKFPRELSRDERAWIDQLISRWPAEIGGITRLHWGQDVSGRSRGYQLALVMEFASEEAARRYHPHPLHQEFAQWVGQQGGEVLAFDFPIDGD
ncbi:MAG: Dabb family protein [Firmicutes bacterium]|nr:Dabb family protein [Bacillota bacterium]